MVFRFLLLVPAFGKLCEKDLVPCISLPDGVQMPMVALGSWRGSYKDCASSSLDGLFGLRKPLARPKSKRNSS